MEALTCWFSKSLISNLPIAPHHRSHRKKHDDRHKDGADRGSAVVDKPEGRLHDGVEHIIAVQVVVVEQG